MACFLVPATEAIILDSRITTLAFRNPAITIATFGEQAMD